ncbi:MAG: heavy metal translocating P-type ATPase [Verrucomicrobia bacterium]|nr:heavy metal translocating P-type ATPase [Verrucomicrobiota bacterium]
MQTDVNGPSREPGLQADQRLVDRGWLRIGAGATVAGQAMVFSLSVNLSEIDGLAYVVVHGILILSALGALVFLGGDLVRSAWASVREREIGIDLLFLITLLGALFGSLVSTFTKAGSVYYEVVAILIVVHTVGKMLGARSRVAALRAVDDTREKFEWCEVVQADGSVKRCRISELAAGARVRVAPGGAISVDGEILSGRGYVQETSMTGEWRPEPRGPGDRVLAGTFSVDGSFDIGASGGVRKLDAILDVVGKARLAPSRLQQQADRLMAWFLPLVVGVSVATFTWWYTHGPWDRALFNAMAVLLVACPCAMGLATPVAVWGGLARLAKLGLVTRTGDFLDVLARVDQLCIDKTGTLSTDALSVKTWRIEPAFHDREAWLKSAVAEIEAGLAHPIAQALREKCHVLRDTFPQTMVVTERQIVAGQGVKAQVALDDDGRYAVVAVGEASLGDQEQCHVLRDTFSGKEVYVFVDGELAATVELEERWRDGLDETLGGLRALGIQTEVLSGDPRAAEVLGTVVAVRAGLSPAQKHQRIVELVGSGRTVLFVGDGINDAAAMSGAQGSIAMRGGADLARASSMAVFVGDDLRFLPRAIILARAARQSIRTNLLFASAYNIAGMALAAAGMLHPVAAALLMLGSSVIVSVNALRTGRDSAQAR